MSKQKLIVIGFGRMGITHTAIINGLFPNQYSISIVEPDKKIALIIKKTLGYKVYKDIHCIDINQAKVLVTTPPFFHKEIAEVCFDKGAKAVFIEKPFGLFDQRVSERADIYVGYVLRFSEVAQKLKKIVESEGCVKISLDYSSNTLTKSPSGWRNSIYGGVLNEMGSHLIDLLFYLTGRQDFVVEESSIKSVISNVDDIVYLRGRIGETFIELSLNWVNPKFRKPVWSGRIQTNFRTVNFDQQSIDGGFNAYNVNYYVRGRDFSLQMEHFMEENNSIACDAQQANIVHDLIMKIKSNS